MKKTHLKDLRFRGVIARHLFRSTCTSLFDAVYENHYHLSLTLEVSTNGIPPYECEDNEPHGSLASLEQQMREQQKALMRRMDSLAETNTTLRCENELVRSKKLSSTPRYNTMRNYFVDSS